MTTTAAPMHHPRTARELAKSLSATQQSPGPAFSPELVRGLPEPARRWLTRAIAPGAPVASVAELRMHGEIKLGRHWHDFTAEQVLAPEHGFVWAARTHIAGFPVGGFDSYFDGTGAMRWRMLGVPVIRDVGSAVTRSAFGRLAAESVLLPTSLVDATWRHSFVGPDAAIYAYTVDGCHAHVTINVAADGRLLGVTMHRWGDPLGQGFQLQPFAVSFAGEYDAGLLKVPDKIVASWPASGREFFRASLDAFAAC